jgi:hypothetical protein
MRRGGDAGAYFALKVRLPLTRVAPEAAGSASAPSDTARRRDRDAALPGRPG